MSASTLDARILVAASPQLRDHLAQCEGQLPPCLAAVDDEHPRLDLDAVQSLRQFMQSQAGSGVSFHELITSCEMLLPSPVFPPRSPELEARIQRLRAQQDSREYRQMTRNIDQKDIMSSLMSDEPIGQQLREINNYMLMIFQFVLSVVTSFVAGYYFPYYFYGVENVGRRLLVGIILAFVVAMADLYFVIRFFLETDGIINVTGKRDKLKEQ